MGDVRGPGQQSKLIAEVRVIGAVKAFIITGVCFCFLDFVTTIFSSVLYE